MLRKLPAKGMAGLHCQRVNSPSRVPLPPARMSATVSRARSVSNRLSVLIAARPWITSLLYCSSSQHEQETFLTRRWRKLARLPNQPIPQRGDLGQGHVGLRAHEIVGEAMRQHLFAGQHEPPGLELPGRERPTQDAVSQPFDGRTQ